MMAVLVLRNGDGVFRGEGRRRQSVGVIEIDNRRIGPPVPDVFRLRDPRIAHRDGLAVNARGRSHKAAIVPGNLEPSESASFGHQSTRRVIEPDAHAVTDRKSTRLNSSHLGISYA